jgi:ATP adenylyltransferase
LSTKGLEIRIEETTSAALASGALIPIATEHEIVEEHGIPFVVHVLARLERKELATGRQRRTGVNPFLPPDPELTVADLSATHLCVLNKFNVIDRHLLIITREFEDQNELLTREDFEALEIAMGEFGGLGFYNAGTIAGASQPHKHLQLVPLPLGSGPTPTPVDAVLTDLDSLGLCTHPSLSFRHVIVALSNPRASDLYELYRQLLETVGIDRTDQPYNLLVTSSWMMLAPRSREHWEEVSVNSLGFAGSLLVPDRDGLERVRRNGPMRVLSEVTGGA